MKRLLLAGTAGSALLLAHNAAFGQETTIAPPPPVGDPGRASDTAGVIVVTGVRGARPRTVADSPVPIDVLSADEIQRTGRVGLKEILGNIVPSLTMPAIGNGTSASVRPISIRGLSGDYLLVLVNGKRRHTSSLINNLSRISGGSTPVDIDLIPTNAIGRIEVLRDGAAAQYGSDAIAGVLNIVLDDSPEGSAISATSGQTYSRGGALAQVNLSHGSRIGGDGSIRFAIDAKYHDRARSSAEPVPYIYPFVNGAPDPREAGADHLIAGGYGRSNRDTIVNASYNAKLPLGEDLTVYSFSTLSYRDVRDARGAFVPSPIGYGGQANPLANSVLPEVYPNGFQAYRTISEWDFQAAAGLKGNLSGWDWDLSTSYGRDHVKLGADNTLNPTIGPDSPTRFFMGKQIQDLWVNNFDATRSYELGLAQPLSVAVGLEHRWERFQSLAGEPDSYRNGGYLQLRFPDRPPPSPGLVSFTGTSPADAVSLSRNNFAGYIDLATNITDPWFVGFAARLEHYDDSAGDTASWKISSRYELSPGLAVRGGANTGFRAPSLAQTGFSTTQVASTLNGSQLVTTTSMFLPVNSAAALALGAAPLKPEKSLSYTVGMTFERGPVRLTVDAYQITINDRITKTEFIGTPANGGAAVRAILLANGIEGVDSAQFFTNAIKSRTRGIDAVAEYNLRTSDFGQFKLSAAYSYNKNEILSVIDNPPELNLLNVTLFGRQARRDLMVATPRDKVILTTDWNLGSARALLRFTRFGKYIESSNVPAGDIRFGAKWITDLDIGYDLTKSVTISVGANNLFDVYPDKNGIVIFEGSGAYGNFAPFGLSGGFYYGRLSIKI